jgi:hypothetical protein
MLLIGVVGQTEMAMFLADPGGARWKDKKFERKLKQRLGTSYTSYLEIITQLMKTAEQFKERLRLNSSGKVPFSCRTVFPFNSDANLLLRHNSMIRTPSKSTTNV